MIKNTQNHLFFINFALLFTCCAIHPSSPGKHAPKESSSKGAQSSSNPTTPITFKPSISVLTVTTSSTALSTNALGTAYPIPALPAQTATAYGWGTHKVGRSDEAYVLALIEDGSHALATLPGEHQDAKLPGRHSAGVLNLTSAMIAHQDKHRTEQTKMFEEHRKESTEDSKQLLLVLQAINSYKTKQIDAPRLESEFERIKRLRVAQEQHLATLIKEAYELDLLMKKEQEELSKAHLAGPTYLPLTPRKNLKEFTENALK